MRQQGKVSAGFLDAVDLGMLGENLIGLRREGNAGPGGDVIEDDGQLHPVGYVFIMLDETSLRRLVVIGSHMQQSVGPGVLSVLGQVNGSGCIVASRAGDDLDPMIDPLDTVFHGGNMLPNGKGGALAGGAADADSVQAACDLLVDQSAEPIVIDSAALVKWGHNGGAGSGKNRFSHDRGLPP